MKNRKRLFQLTVALTLFVFVGITALYAQTTRALKTGNYAADGTNLTMELRSDRTMTVYRGGTRSGNWAAGTYRISGDNKMITLSFDRVNGDLSYMRGVSISYGIVTDEMFYNNELTWVYTGR